MSRVIALQEYRERKMAQAEAALGLPPRRISHISNESVWTRDYNTLTGIIYGLLRVREVLDSHFHYCEEWKYHLLSLIEHAYFLDQEDHATRLVETCELLKTYLVEQMNVINRQEFSIALLILELIQKSNRARNRLSQ